MPIFEYRCSECGNKYEVLHKSSSSNEEIICPECHSANSKKLLSTFSASFAGGTDFSSGGYGSDSTCSTGTCGCGSGSCGLE